MTWPTDAALEEYQTFEYVLEYGREGESSAIVRTFLQGRPATGTSPGTCRSTTT